MSFQNHADIIGSVPDGQRNGVFFWCFNHFNNLKEQIYFHRLNQNNWEIRLLIRVFGWGDGIILYSSSAIYPFSDETTKISVWLLVHIDYTGFYCVLEVSNGLVILWVLSLLGFTVSGFPSSPREWLTGLACSKLEREIDQSLFWLHRLTHRLRDYNKGTRTTFLWQVAVYVCVCGSGFILIAGTKCSQIDTKA